MIEGSMDCTRVESFMKEWATNPEAPLDRAAEILAHARTCPSCRARYGNQLPLIERDAGMRLRTGQAGAQAPVPGIADAVMEKIGEIRPSRAPRTIFIRYAIPLAAAALLVLALGLPRFIPGKVVQVRFSLYAPEATQVALAAEFNGWSPEGFELKRSDQAGVWEITVPLERGRSYLYNFVLDGELWVADPNAGVFLDDGFGTQSSSMTI